MNNLEQISSIVRANKMPYLYLHTKRNAFDTAFVGSFECEICQPEQTLEQKTEIAITWLNDYVKNNFTGNYNFLITMKTAPRANQNGVIGPLEFYYSSDKKEKEQTFNGLNGLGSLNPQVLSSMGYLTESEVNYRLMRQQMEFEKELAKRDLEDLKKQYQENLQEIKKSSDKWSPDAMKGMMTQVAGIAGVLTGKIKAEQLLGLGQVEEEEEKEETIEDLMISQATEEMREMNAKEIQAAIQMLRNFKQKVREKEQTQNDSSEQTKN